MRSIAVLLFAGMLILLIVIAPGSSAQRNQAVILSYSGYTDTLGYYHVVGEVRNLGPSTLSQVTINASLCNPASTFEDYTMISILLAQQKSPFDLFENSTGRLCGVIVSGANVTKSVPYRAFQVLSPATSRDSTGIYHVTGQVNNTGTSVGQAVEVVATFYNASGAVVQVGSSLTSPPDLAPGQRGYFDIPSDDPTMSAQITSYELQIQSASPVFAVPEYALSGPVLVLSLAVVVVIGRRKTKSKGTHATL